MRSHRFPITMLLAVAVLALAAAAALATPVVTTTYTSPNLKINVVGDGSTYNRLEVPCATGDVVGNYSVAPTYWSVASVHLSNGSTFVQLVRTSPTTDSSLVTLTGPANRGVKGSVVISNGGATPSSGDGPTMLGTFTTPGIGPVGLGILLALLVAAGGIAVARTRRAEGTSLIS